MLIQHMPAAFTKAFAERLDKLCNISVKEAEDGDILRPGLALLAPGGKQMMIDGRGAVKNPAGRRASELQALRGHYLRFRGQVLR
nr:hypothetical protein GCM10020185_09670 [Pseudomonas brassicacearum subsp. brassicacearum]